MIYTKPEMVLMAVEAAEKHGINPAFVCALIEVATHWNPSLIEWNPAPHLASWPASGREDHTFGLMQIQGEAEGNLLDPQWNLDIGCRMLKDMLTKVNNNYEVALKLWWNMRNPPKVSEVMRLRAAYESFLLERVP